jgi:hypothetical protein
VRHGAPFTTAYHTQFPDYLAKRTGLPASLFWPFIRRFHGPAQRTMVSTPSIAGQLEANGIGPTHRWGRGVDLELFHPDIDIHRAMARLPRPIQLYVGRVAVEKNIGAFLASSHPGSQVVVGDGPAREDAAAPLSAGALPRRAQGPHPRLRLCQRRCPRLSQPHGHFRPGDHRGTRLRHAGRRLSGIRTDRRYDRGGRRHARGPGRSHSRRPHRDRTRCRIYAEGFSWDASTAQFLAGLEPAIVWSAEASRVEAPGTTALQL